MGFRRILIDELTKRRMKNKYYSLRAFARDLQIPASRLSEILNNKVGISAKRAASIANIIGLTQEETELFITLVESECARSKIAKQEAKQRILSRQSTNNTQLHTQNGVDLRRSDTFAIHPDDIPQIKKAIADFCNSLIKEFKTSQEENIGCYLSVQLFSIDE